MNLQETRPQDDVFIFFDLGNVIAKFDHERAVANLSEATKIPQARIRKVLFESDLQQKYEIGELTTRQFYECFCEQTKCHANFDDVIFAISDIFSLNQHIMPLLTQLYCSGFSLGILSNTCEAHWAYLLKRYTILATLFRCHILSYQAGSMKPASDIYRIAESNVRSDKGFQGSTIFFADDRPENVEGAREFGWHAKVFQGTRELYRDLRELDIVIGF